MMGVVSFTKPAAQNSGGGPLKMRSPGGEWSAIRELAAGKSQTAGARFAPRMLI
jgi:hypothetical protein